MPANIRAVTTLRTGGISQGNFASLNMADHVGDRFERVKENRQRIIRSLNLPSEPVWLNQVHGSSVARVDTKAGRVNADAGYTQNKGVVCVVLTADCLPVLLCSRQGDEIAAVHGGWRGLLAGVIEKTIENMDGEKLIAWMGPAIGPEVFEVGHQVRTAFIEKSAEFNHAFCETENGKWLADIYQIATIILSNQGVKKIYGGGFCTLTDKERFFSYRRDGETGRMASLIWRES